MKRTKTDLIVIHVSATRVVQDIGVKEIRAWHTNPNKRPRPFADIGYHYVIRLSGALELGRDTEAVGAHVAGYNRTSIGICLVGGLGPDGKASVTFNRAQIRTLKELLRLLKATYPTINRIVGHRDLSPDLDGDGVVERHEWIKECPCFDVAHWLETGELK